MGSAMHNFFLYILVGLPKTVFRYPYLSISALCHLIAIAMLCYFGIYKVSLENHNKRLQSYVQKTHQAEIARQVESGIKNLEQMEMLMAQSIDSETLKNDQVLAELVKKTLNKQQLKSGQVKDRLAQAKQISENITEMEQSLRAQDLERVMSISHEEALKKVVQAESTNKPPPDTSLVKVVELLEKKAGEALKRREKQLDREQIGIPISFFDEQNFQFNKNGNGMDGANGRDAGNVYAELPKLQKIKSYISSKMQHSEFKKNDYVDVWLSHMPDVGIKNAQKQMGRIIGSEGAFADRIFVNSWYIIGPFNDPHKKYPPEYEIDLDAEYLGKNQKFRKWQYVHDGFYPLVPPQDDKVGIFYGYTEVILEQDQDLWVWIGADDFVSLWLNETALWESNSFNWKFNALAYDNNKTEWNNWNLTEYKRRVHFKKGTNRFFFKLTNIQDNCFFSLILTKQ